MKSASQGWNVPCGYIRVA